MKDETIPIPREEDFVAANRRRDDYALKRDQQALEFNQAISKRELAEPVNKVKCKICGKEFSEEVTSENQMTCPECM